MRRDHPLVAARPCSDPSPARRVVGGRATAAAAADVGGGRRRRRVGQSAGGAGAGGEVDVGAADGAPRDGLDPGHGA
jgi:hypothetical protein